LFRNWWIIINSNSASTLSYIILGIVCVEVSIRITTERYSTKTQFMKSASMKLLMTLLLTTGSTTRAFVPFLDGGKGMPNIYDGWFNEQIAKQAATAMGKAIAAGNVRD
jgi:hypothetical protein